MHAYLIMAHGSFGILEKLIRALDSAETDLYVHIDKSVKKFDFEYFRHLTKKSAVFFTDRVKVCWGDYSMVEAEYILLKTAFAAPKKYKYFHLLSGVDLPLKSISEINAFFDTGYPKEFVHFAQTMNDTEKSRVKHYHFFAGRRNLFNRIMTKSEQVLQKALRIDRTKGKKIARGSQWFSITDKFAEYLIDNEKMICRNLKHTFIPDEFFVQMTAVNTLFAENLYSSAFDDSCEQNMRYIDWKRGNPYTFKETDIEEIMDSGCLFVRKLTESNHLPEMIINRL